MNIYLVCLLCLWVGPEVSNNKNECWMTCSIIWWIFHFPYCCAKLASIALCIQTCWYIINSRRSMSWCWHKNNHIMAGAFTIRSILTYHYQAELSVLLCDVGHGCICTMCLYDIGSAVFIPWYLLINNWICEHGHGIGGHNLIYECIALR